VVRGGDVTDQSLMARRVGELDYQLAAAPGYLARHGTPQHPRELQDTQHRVVGYFGARSGKMFPYRMHRGSETLEVQGHYTVAVNDGSAYLVAGLAGLGILLVPLLEDWRFDPIALHVAFPPNRHVSTKLRVFIDWVAELMTVHAPVKSGPRARSGAGAVAR